MQPPTIIVTGAAGFLGSALTVDLSVLSGALLRGEAHPSRG